MLSAASLSQFATDGFTVAPQFFTPAETAVIQAEVRRFQNEGLFRNVSTAGDGITRSASARNLQLCPTAPYSEAFRSLPFAGKVVDAVRALLGNPVMLQLDQVFLKPGGDGVGTNWHQDNAYFKVADSTKGTAMWIAVHDAVIANGTVHVIPGVQRQVLEHMRDGDSDHHIRCFPPEEREVACQVPAGGAVFFQYGVPHRTGANTTDRERAGLALHFVRQDFATPDLLQPGRTYNPVLTGPDADGGLSVYGADLRGRWEELVAGSASRVR
jgi:phytanoyl-CoA hydroxylase